VGANQIIRFGWTGDERLVVINEEGTYRLYDLQGDYQQFSLEARRQSRIIDAKIHDSGLVAMTGSLRFLEVKGWRAESIDTVGPGIFPISVYLHDL